MPPGGTLGFLTLSHSSERPRLKTAWQVIRTLMIFMVYVLSQVIAKEASVAKENPLKLKPGHSDG